MSGTDLQDLLFRGVGGLGLFMVGMEFLSDGMQSLAVRRMRRVLERFTTNRVFALLTGTFITGVIQSSTVMTLMVVGFVDSGVVTLEQAIGLIMGANIGTTLTTIFVALPIGKWGLPVIGVAGLTYIFAKKPATRYVALSVLGLGMIFFGLDLLITGLRPLRTAPQVMKLFTWVSAASFGGVVLCVVLSAVVTAIIHSSSATIGIVMGLGASGVMDWQTALAFTLGADIGTTATAYVATLNLSANAKRAAYAHAAFNVIGVLVMLPLFPLATRFIAWILGGDPIKPMVAADGTVKYTLVPIAVATFSTVFNVFNTALMLPFVPLMARVLKRFGKAEGEEDDVAVPQFLFARALEEPESAVRMLEKEQLRYQRVLPRLLTGARPETASHKAAALYTALSTLAREIDGFAADLCKRPLPPPLVPVLMRLLQAQDHSRTLARALAEIAGELGGKALSPAGRQLAEVLVESMEALLLEALNAFERNDRRELATLGVLTGDQGPAMTGLRASYLEADTGIPMPERTSFLTVLGLVESFRWSLNRLVALRLAEPAPESRPRSGT